MTNLKSLLDWAILAQSIYYKVPTSTSDVDDFTFFFLFQEQDLTEQQLNDQVSSVDSDLKNKSYKKREAMYQAKNCQLEPKKERC